MCCFSDIFLCCILWRNFWKSFHSFLPEHQICGSIRWCSQLPLCTISGAVTPSSRGKQQLCACLCFSVLTHMDVQPSTSALIWWNVHANFFWLLKHFPNEPLPWHLQQCDGWRHGNRLLSAYLGPSPRQGVVLVVCVCVCVCITVLVRVD